MVCFEIVIHNESEEKIAKETERFAKNTKIFNARPVILKPEKGAEGKIPIVIENLNRFGFHLINQQAQANIKNKDYVITRTAENKRVTLHKTIRSGQSYNIDGDMVLFGNLNAGAEIKATGNIVILGTSNGIVHAGINGNKNAVIFAMKLLSPQIRIADKVARAPQDTSNRKPEIAFLSSEVIVVQDYNDWLIKNEKLNLGA